MINPRQPSFDTLNSSTALYLPFHSLAFASTLPSIRRTNLIHEFIFSCAMDSPLYTLDNVIITPHMGWKGLETRQRLVGIIRDNVQAFFKGEPINVVS